MNPEAAQAVSAGSASVGGLLWTVILVAVALFLVVEAGVALVALKPGTPSLLPVSRRGRWAAIAWLALPAAILVGLTLWSAHVLSGEARLGNAAPDLTVSVSGKRYVWTIRYQDRGREVMSLNQLHLPLGKVARLKLRAEDVAHGFWVPQFRVRETVVPGEEREVYLQPLAAGDFNIVCAELCGDSHYAMRGFVHVESPEAFQAWLEAQPSETVATKDR